MNKFAYVMALPCLTAAAFEADQLPLSDEIAKSFPLLKSNCYMVINIDTNVVVTSSNSERPIETGTFNNVCKVGERATLHEMSQKINAKQISFQSEMSGYGCAERYVNKNGATFVIILYGEPTKALALTDVAKIKAWLEQFYVFDIKQTYKRLQIPVIYGIKSMVKVIIPEIRPILLSRKGSKKIEKIFRYRTILKAPIETNEEIGYILYYTDIFKNPIKQPIKTEYTLKKSRWFQCICDSVQYLIFGTSIFMRRE